MKRLQFVKQACLFSSFLFFSGCSWTLGKLEKENVGHVYPGTTLSTAEAICGIPEHIANDDISFIVKVFSVPHLVVYNTVDLAFSLTMDTLFLPVDLITEPEAKRKTVMHYCYKSDLLL